ncbi:hypothetical protein [Nocardia xishanensis]
MADRTVEEVDERGAEGGEVAAQRPGVGQRRVSSLAASSASSIRFSRLLQRGTLPGGSGMELGRWLAPGDELRLEIDGIGVIEHRIEQ